MKNLRTMYPNTTKTLSENWISRFEKSENSKKVEFLFDYLEDKYLEESKKIDTLNEDLYTRIDIISRDWKNYLQISLEKLYYNVDYDAWESSHEYPVAIEVKIEDYYKNNEEECTQQKLEDFLEALPENLDEALI